MLANLTTVQKRSKELESGCVGINREENSRVLVVLSTLIASDKAIRNYSPAFIDGIVGSALKKDNVAKHQKTDMHSKAVNMELQPTRTINSILTSTPLGKAFASVHYYL